MNRIHSLKVRDSSFWCDLEQVASAYLLSWIRKFRNIQWVNWCSVRTRGVYDALFIVSLLSQPFCTKINSNLWIPLTSSSFGWRLPQSMSHHAKAVFTATMAEGSDPSNLSKHLDVIWGSFVLLWTLRLRFYCQPFDIPFILYSTIPFHYIR